MTLSDPDFVARQYGSAANLDARISLHRRFGTAEEPPPRWIFGQLDLPLDAATKEPAAFSLENGEVLPSHWFLEVSLRRRGGALLVTEAEPLIEYLLSGVMADAAAGEPAAELCRRVSDLAARLRRKLDLHGAIRITTHPGLFVARR